MADEVPDIVEGDGYAVAHIERSAIHTAFARSANRSA
jgi:hypothetical protein